MKALIKRNLKEISRDPVSMVFCVCFPVVMLIVLQLILKGQQGFEIVNFAPGIANFGFTFTMLYIALMISGDKSSAFMSRLFVSPLKPMEYLLSYVISALPIMLIQTVLFYAIAFIFGLPFTWNTLLSVVYLLPACLFYISCGLLIGCLAPSEKQAGPISSIIISGSGILGGVWMPVESIGGTFLSICQCLPFYCGVKSASQAIKGDIGGIYPWGLIILGYTVIVFIVSVILFKTKMKK